MGDLLLSEVNFVCYFLFTIFARLAN